MSMLFISNNAFPTYIALSTDITSGSIVGTPLIGKTIYTIDDGNWYIITGTSGSSYKLQSFDLPGNDEINKLTSASSLGLFETYNSIGYRVAEIERHLHSAGSWFGVAVTPDGETHVADRIGTTTSPLRIDAGDNTWGSWTQILGSDDTPARANGVYFDPHEIIVENVENASEYFIQITRGDSGEAGYSAGNYTEFVFNATVQKETGILSIHTGRAPVGAKLWARCWSVGDNTGTFDFFLGIHEYEG